MKNNLKTIGWLLLAAVLIFGGAYALYHYFPRPAVDEPIPIPQKLKPFHPPFPNIPLNTQGKG